MVLIRKRPQTTNDTSTDNESFDERSNSLQKTKYVLRFGSLVIFVVLFFLWIMPFLSSIEEENDNSQTSQQHKKKSRGHRGGNDGIIMESSNSHKKSSSSHTSSKSAEAAEDGISKMEEDPNPSAPFPRIAWLMSYPNSGTSFTSVLTRHVSNRTVASNYAAECHPDTNTAAVIVPVHENIPHGPCYNWPGRYAYPETYVLTKTHCGGRCLKCDPSKYVETLETFHQKCRTTSSFHTTTKNNNHNKDNHNDDDDDDEEEDHNDNNDKSTKSEHPYDGSIVQRAVYIIRDPFNNIVSRFHHERKGRIKKGDEAWLEKYPSTPKGFQAFCNYLDQRYAQSEQQWFFHSHHDKQRQQQQAIGKEEFDIIPCHAEFFRYIQWHNYATQVAFHVMKLPTHIIHYEEYERDFEGTVESLLEFLKLAHEGDLPQFVKGKQYRDDHFTSEQREVAMKMMKRLASQQVWDLLRVYDID